MSDLIYDWAGSGKCTLLQRLQDPLKVTEIAGWGMLLEHWQLVAELLTFTNDMQRTLLSSETS